MKLINHNQKQVIAAGFAKKANRTFDGLWLGALGAATIGESVGGLLGLIAQIIHLNNDNPLISKAQFVDNPAPKLYTRIGKYPSQTTFGIGSPFF